VIQVAARYPDGNPLRRAGTAWDVAVACIFLGRPTTGSVIGETLEVSGGGNLWVEVLTLPKPEWFRMASRALDPELEKGMLCAKATGLVSLGRPVTLADWTDSITPFDR